MPCPETAGMFLGEDQKNSWHLPEATRVLFRKQKLNEQAVARGENEEDSNGGLCWS